MAGFRSVLWVGDGAGIDMELVSRAPSVEFTWAKGVDEASALSPDLFDVAVLDAPDPAAGASGLRRLRARLREIPILVRLPHGGTLARHALRAVGAADVLLSDDPQAIDVLDRIACVLEPREAGARRALSSRARDAHESGRRPACASEASTGIIGASPPMRAVLALIERAARNVVTVLVTGETGTGKELLARAIHTLSSRRAREFVAVNCAAFPDTLLESELCGHVRGAFTGADRDKKGLFECADGGTIFLDEIGETSPALQAKLLRVLQEREVRPVGGVRARRIDLRVVAATNRDLRAAVANGSFRADLYYRLAVFPIALPALRSRGDDVLRLAHHLLARAAEREACTPAELSDSASGLLRSYGWPGNVRELENELTRALALVEPGEALRPEHFSERLRGLTETAECAADRLDLSPREGEPLRATMGRIEAALILRTLDATNGQRTAAARRLGITREGLYKKMARFGIR